MIIQPCRINLVIQNGWTVSQVRACKRNMADALNHSLYFRVEKYCCADNKRCNCSGKHEYIFPFTTLNSFPFFFQYSLRCRYNLIGSHIRYS